MADMTTLCDKRTAVISCNTTRLREDIEIHIYLYISNQYEQIVVGPLYLMMTSARLFSTWKEIEPLSFKAAKYFVKNIFILSKNFQVPLLQHLNLILRKE